MAAVLAAAMVMATALAVDVGRITFTSRDQQGVTDRTVLDALRHLESADSDGDGITDVDEGADLATIHALVTASVSETLAANTEGSSVGTARDRQASLVEIGYQDPSCPGISTFCLMYDGPGGTVDPYPGTYVPLAPNRTMNAIRVATTSDVDYVFGFIGGQDTGRTVVKEAVGTDTRTCVPGTTGCPLPCPVGPCGPVPVDAEAGISVATRLIELDTSDSALNDARLEVLRQLLGELIGLNAPTTVTAAGFDGLARTTIPLGVLADAGATIGTTDQLLASDVSVSDLLTVMASGATSSDSTVTAAASSALLTLASQVTPGWTVSVGDLISTTTEDPTALLTGQVSTLDVLVTVLMNAEFVNGDHLLQLDLDGSLLGTDLFGLDGLLDVTASLTVIEPPQMAYGPVRYDTSTGRYQTFAETAQVSTSIDIHLNQYYAETLLGPLEDLISGLVCLLGPLLCPSTTVSVDVAAAWADAQLTGIDCVDPTGDTDVTTVVSSDALMASVDGGSVTLVDSRDGTTAYGVGGEVVVVDTVPGMQATTDASVSGVAAVDALLEPVLSLLGISAGTAYVGTWAVRCDVPVLLANPVGP